jgi:hypothetical protein
MKATKATHPQKPEKPQKPQSQAGKQKQKIVHPSLTS